MPGLQPHDKCLLVRAARLIVCAVVVSVVCIAAGIVASILAGTPVERIYLLMCRKSSLSLHIAIKLEEICLLSHQKEKRFTIPRLYVQCSCNSLYHLPSSFLYGRISPPKLSTQTIICMTASLMKHSN